MTDDAEEVVYADPICPKCGRAEGLTTRDDPATEDSPVYCKGCGGEFGMSVRQIKLAAAKALFDRFKGG